MSDSLIIDHKSDAMNVIKKKGPAAILKKKT